MLASMGKMNFLMFIAKECMTDGEKTFEKSLRLNLVRSNGRLCLEPIDRVFLRESV
jgi:hypothetical protein